MTELRVERHLSASPDRVWRAFTSADALSEWLWPPAFATIAITDPTVGGRYRIASEVAGMAVGGEYVALDEPRGLVQTWQWEGEAGQTLVTVTIDPERDGTLLTVVHERFDTGDERDSHIQGWNDCLDRLEPYLTP